VRALDQPCFWSFVFCLKDPVQFLLDNQRPLDLEATYRATVKCVLREAEDLTSMRIGTIPKGARLKVVEQRGRRVFVKMNGSDQEGWISYLSDKGVALLSKQGLRGRGPVTGTIGASELSRMDDPASLLEVGRGPGGIE